MGIIPPSGWDRVNCQKSVAPAPQAPTGLKFTQHGECPALCKTHRSIFCYLLRRWFMQKKVGPKFLICSFIREIKIWEISHSESLFIDIYDLQVLFSRILWSIKAISDTSWKFQRLCAICFGNVKVVHCTVIFNSYSLDKHRHQISDRLNFATICHKKLKMALVFFLMDFI